MPWTTSWCISVTLINTAQEVMHFSLVAWNKKKNAEQQQLNRWKSKVNNVTVLHHCLIDRWSLDIAVQRCQSSKNVAKKHISGPHYLKDENSSAMLYVLLHRQHVSMVTRCLVMKTGPWISIQIYLLCLHIISVSHLHFHFSFKETRFILLHISLSSPFLPPSLPHTNSFSVYFAVSLNGKG